MYLDSKTLAFIQMNAVLTSLKLLCELDDQAKQIIANKNLSVSFNIFKGPKLTLVFKNGACRIHLGESSGDIKLGFKSFDHFNAVLANQAQPFVFWGFHKLSFLLKDFKKLSDRLEYFLKPEDPLFSNLDFQSINTHLMANLAVKASIELGNHDPQMNQIRESFPKGVMCFGIEGTLKLFIENKDGVLRLIPNAKTVRANIIFKDVDSACALLNGKIDSFSSVALGNLKVNGFIPMLEHFDKYLFKVNHYLK